MTLASLILLGGALGDRFGRRRIFELGVIWFTIASLACALSPTVEVLIGARLAQGVGGALLTPGSLAIIEGTFRREDRARAIGAWSALGGIAAAVGPLLGGWLVDANNSTLLRGDVAEEVGKLKREQNGDIVVHGSARLVQTLLEHNLVDELRLMVFPVVLGTGKRLFGAASDKKRLRLTDSRTVGDGVEILVYETARHEDEGTDE